MPDNETHLSLNDPNDFADFDEIVDKAYVMVPTSSASSVAMLMDHKYLHSDHPHPAITLIGHLTDPERDLIKMTSNDKGVVTLVFSDFDEVQRLVGNLLGLVLSEDNLHLAWSAIAALANQEQDSVFQKAAKEVLERLEKDEEEK